MYLDIRLHHTRTFIINIILLFSRHNEAKNFKPVTLPGQEAAADYQVKLFALELKKDILCCMFLKWCICLTCDVNILNPQAIVNI